MTLVELLNIFPRVNWGAIPRLRERNFSKICVDSRKLTADCIFVAIRGTKSDGHAFVAEAAEKGALALVVEDLAEVPVGYRGAVIEVESARRALNKIAAHYYNQPSRELFCAGVTGTNGKTTLTHMIEAILNHADQPTGVVGTIDHHLVTGGESHVWKTELTTPDPLEFQQRLRQFRDLGARALAMEVSNVGLLQNRADEVAFDVAVFTNLTRDHLDIHPDMEDYFAAKRRLFSELLLASDKPRPTAVINGNDDYGKRLLKEIRGLKCAAGGAVTAWSYGHESLESHDLSFLILEQGFFGTRFCLRTPVGSQDFEIQMPGMHNVYNAAGAIGAALVAGVSLADCAAALKSLTGVRGRLEAVPNARGLYVFVDYAHTDDALATILHYLGKLRTEAGLKNKIITVFGCGGDRDKGKRPLMMKAAARASDLVVVTSDNPRTEDPEAIVRDILTGADTADIGERVHAVVDRRDGIRRALEIAVEGDVILIAGKGHEDYQIIGSLKQKFNDVEVVKELLA